MASVYKVAEIEGKGLGCVAILDIEKGSLILNESSQMRGIPLKIRGNSKWMKILLKSFYQMGKADQLEFRTLRNKWINIPDYKNYKEAIDKELDYLKSEVSKIEHDPEKAEEIFNICCIYLSNRRSVDQSESGLMIKTSRFKHSCKPNAISMIKADDLFQIRAISNIKAGQEIHIDYNGENDPFFKFRNRQQRQKILFEGWFFVCSCDFCENGVDIDANAYEKWIQEGEKLTINRKSAHKAGRSLGHLHYSLEDNWKEVNCYKQLYKVGKVQKIQPILLYNILDRGFFTALFGYQLYKTAELKIDARNFAKAAEKFGKILGNDIVFKPDKLNYYKQHYQNCIDKSGY